MAIPAAVAIEIRKQHDLVVSLDSVVVTETAKQIAFYMSMYSAMLADDDLTEEESRDYDEFYSAVIDKLLSAYMTAVDDLV